MVSADPLVWILECYADKQWDHALSALDQELSGDDRNPALMWLR